MTSGRDQEINVLKLTLHNQLVGYLAGFHNGRNVLSFAPNFRYDTYRATFSLITHPNFPHADKLMAEPWYQVSYAHFEYWAKKSGIPWRAIKPHLDDVMEKARSLWPQALKNLPMNEEHKQKLIKHWQNLHQDFRVI